MKKAAVWLLALLFVGLAFGTSEARAASVTVSFSGPDKVKAGGTYTYTYEINVNSAAVAYITPITASGVFELISGGDGLMYDTIPDNTSGSSDKGTIEVRVKSNAKPGDKATLSTSGEYSVLDEEYNQKNYTFQGSFLASVVSGSAPDKTAPPAPSPTAEPSSAPTLTPTATPETTPIATPTIATPVATPTATPAVALPAATTSPSPSSVPADVTEQESQPPQDDGDTVPTQASSANGGGSVWMIAVIIAVIALAVGLMIALYVRRAGPFKSKGAAAAARGTMNSVRRSAYRKRGRHRR